MRYSVLYAVLILCAAQAQDTGRAYLVGGPCEGCEAIFEYGDRLLFPIDTLPDFATTEPRIKVTGTIYQSDGRTPAEGVILYIYHTDRQGLYAPSEGAAGWERRHGYHRGWMKTGKDGRYTFYTYKPASYPNRTIPAHIHPTILEPNGKYYWLGAYHFDDDPFVTDQERNPADPRGGSTGILRLKKEGSLLVGQRDFILGRNITGY